MANKLTDMSKIRKAIKMHCNGNSKLFISKYLSLSRNTVKKYLHIFELYGLTIDDINQKTDIELEQLFSYNIEEEISPKQQAMYDYFPKVQKQLTQPGVTFYKTWEEYFAQHPTGYKESQFRLYYRRWSKKCNPVMHMNHKAGDKMFIDYAGEKLSIVDECTGEITEVEFFIAVLGASQYTYAESSASQKKEDFIASIENALHYFEGVPAAIVPDNLKSAVTKSNRFEPTINETLESMADHYGTAIVPARAHKPKDKALVEGAVKILYNRVYVPLKKEIFHSMNQMNERILELLDIHNSKYLTGRPYSRYDLYRDVDKVALSPLPAQRFEIKYMQLATVMQNGHVQMSADKHFYSVPYHYIRKKVKILYTKSTVEIYFKNNRIAIHPRNKAFYCYSTITEHLASSHKFATEWTAERFMNWARNINPTVAEFIGKIFEHRNHPEQAYKSCMGILSLEKKVGQQRLIDACTRALDYGTYSYKAIAHILEKNLDKIQSDNSQDVQLPEHKNIRGKNYYK